MNTILGDTLFVVGCGNFNSGTPQQMHDALLKIGNLPSHTYVYVGHEYTINNIKYALTVEPNNIKLQQRFEWAKGLRADGMCFL